MDQRLMPDVLDIREVIFTNLLLLDFRPDVFEAKHHCPFTRDAFVFPNKKAMEEVFYFLFMKLNPTVAKEEFRHCWPIHDKKQESTFRKVSVQWLNRLNKEVHDSNIPRVVASVLMSPGGDKFYHLVFCFSSFVLKEEIRKILLRDEMILPWPNTSSTAKSFPHQTSKLLTAKIILENERFLHSAELSAKAQEKWIQFANELTKQNRAIRKRRREVEKELKNLEVEHLKRGLLSPASSQRPHHSSPYSGQIKSLKRTKILQRVRGYWRRISEMHESHRLLREKIDQIVKGSTNKFALRAADINIRVPDLLLRECEEEIYQKRITNTFESGCVNLLSLVQLFNLSLHLILEQVRSHELPSVVEEEADARDKLHSQSAYLQATHSLKEIVENEMIPELNESISELQEMIEFSNSLKHATPKANGKFDFSLAGLPMTPSVHLSTESEFDQEREPVAIPKDLFESSKVLTPDAVEKLVQSLRSTTIDDSPPDNIGKKEMMKKPPPGTATKKSAAPQQQMRRRIPVLVGRSATKQKLDRSTTLNQNSFGTEKELEIRKEVDEKQHKSLDTKRFGDIQQWSPIEKLSKGNDVNQSKGERIARDILADKIAFSVLTKDGISRSPSSSSSSSSSRCQTPKEHALEDPTSAMNKDAFKARDKIQRTPLKKDNQIGQKHSSDDALQSYLRQTLPSENGLTPKVTHLIEGLTGTPKNGLFDGSFYSRTPKQILLHSGNIEKVDRDSNQHMRGRVNDSEREVDTTESPRFDEEFQTPVVNRAIELSVRNSVLEPKGLYDSLGDTDKPLETHTKAVGNTKGGLYTPMSPFNSEKKAISHGPSFSSYSNTEKKVLPNKVPVLDMVPRVEKLEISPEFTGLGLSGNIPIAPKDHTKNTVKDEVQVSSGKDGLAEIIMRYKNLKMKSQKTKFDAHYDPEEEDSFHDKPPETVDDRIFDEKYKAENNENESKVATPNFSFNMNDEDMTSADNQSFIEIARNSATKDVATWATLKKHIASFEDNDEQRLESNYDSFDDLQIPVAKQLSFLQLDTSGMSPPLLRQTSPSRRVGGNGVSLEFGGRIREHYVKPIEPDLHSVVDRSLIFSAQKEALSLDHLTNRKVMRRDAEPRSELREPGISKSELHFKSDKSRTPLTDSPFDTIDQYLTDSKKLQKEAPNDFKTSHTVLETPKSKTPDESFNILTPGLELRRGVELFAMDVKSSGLDGGSPDEPHL